jgi:hypothetical protein
MPFSRDGGLLSSGAQPSGTSRSNFTVNYKNLAADQSSGERSMYPSGKTSDGTTLHRVLSQALLRENIQELEYQVFRATTICSKVAMSSGSSTFESLNYPGKKCLLHGQEEFALDSLHRKGQEPFG